MSALDDMLDGYFGFGMIFDNSEDDFTSDDFAIRERSQRPRTPGDIDWRFEKGGVYFED